MNFLNITESVKITENSYILKNTSLWLWILCFFCKWEDFIGDVYLYRTLDVRSGLEKTFALTSLKNYKQFLYLLDETKKVGTRILCEFSELSQWEKIQVLNGTKKIKWLAQTGITQLEGKILLDETVLSQVEYIKYKEMLQNISTDIKKIDMFLTIQWSELVWKEQQEIINLYLKFNV